MASMKHTHSYERVGTRQNCKIWKCNHPDCTHIIKKEIVVGKRSKCTCGTDFVLDAGALQRKVPKCLNCRNTKEGRRHQKIANLLDTVIGEPEVPVSDFLEIYKD